MSDLENPRPKEVVDMVESMYQWLSKQPHLPRIEDKKLVEKFLINSNFSLQKTKTKIENYYSARTCFPSVFQNRDPCSPEIRAAATQFVPLPERAPNGRKVFVTKVDCDVNEFNPTDYMKRMFMVFDVMFSEETARLDYEVIVDMRGFTFRHFLKLSTAGPTSMTIVENVLPATLKRCHYIHTPPFVDRVVEFFRILVKPELREQFVVYESLDAFYNEIGNRDILPCDLGGKEAPIALLSDLYQKKIELYKSWFEKEENIRSNEDLRLPTSSNSWLMGTEGSFKKVTVDE